MRGVLREGRRVEARVEGREEVILAFLFFGVLGRGNRLSSVMTMTGRTQMVRALVNSEPSVAHDQKSDLQTFTASQVTCPATVSARGPLDSSHVNLSAGGPGVLRLSHSGSVTLSLSQIQ